MKHLSFSAVGRRLCAALAAVVLAVGLAPAASAAYDLPVTPANPEESIYLYNMDNGTVLLDYNSTEVRYVASTTKMMTALLLLESGIDLETVITIPKCMSQEFKDIRATNGTDMNLKVGEEIRLIDLLYGLIVRSANDAASVIAWYLGGQGNVYDCAPFVAMMNARAAELGCTDTTFGCPHGLYDHGNVSTAQDLARIGAACRANELYMQVAETKSYTLPMTNKHPYERDIENVNFMMMPGYEHYREYIHGLKTGFTTLAGRCYVTTATYNGDSYLLVVLGSTKDSIYAECAAILDWAFANFSNRMLLDMQTPVATLALTGCKEAEELQVYATRSVAAYGHNSDEIKLDVQVDEKVRAPIKAGQVMGTVTVSLGGTVVDTVELVTAEAYESAFLSGLKNTVLLVPLLVVLLTALTLLTVKVGGGDAKALAGEMAQTVQQTAQSVQQTAKAVGSRMEKKPEKQTEKKAEKKRKAAVKLPQLGGLAAKLGKKAKPKPEVVVEEESPASTTASLPMFDYEQAPVEQPPDELGFAPTATVDDGWELIEP